LGVRHNKAMKVTPGPIHPLPAAQTDMLPFRTHTSTHLIPSGHTLQPTSQSPATANTLTHHPYSTRTHTHTHTPTHTHTHTHTHTPPYKPTCAHTHTHLQTHTHTH